jgi:hypothetical protein
MCFVHKKSGFQPEAAFFMQNTEGRKPQTFDYQQVVKRFPVKKGINTEGDKTKTIFKSPYLYFYIKTSIFVQLWQKTKYIHP